MRLQWPCHVVGPKDPGSSYANKKVTFQSKWAERKFSVSPLLKGTGLFLSHCASQDFTPPRAPGLFGRFNSVSAISKSNKVTSIMETFISVTSSTTSCKLHSIAKAVVTTSVCIRCFTRHPNQVEAARQSQWDAAKVSYRVR